MEKINFYQYQNKVLEVYKYTKSIFDQFNIPLIANSGTLLGIIRHNEDFIPWDDDLDLMVPLNKFRESYEEIERIINSDNSDYFIFNFLETEKDKYNIRPNLGIVRIYSRKEFLVESFFGEDYQVGRPFIDIFVAVPHDYFNSEKKWFTYARLHMMRWMVGKGFKRYHAREGNNKLQFKKNLRTYPLKLIYWPPIHKHRIKKPLLTTKGNWNIIRRVDKWSYRKVVYNLDELEMVKLRGEDILINKHWEDELINTYGETWERRIPALSHSHSNNHKTNRRNININNFLKDKFPDEAQ